MTIQRLNENPVMRSVFWILGKFYVTLFLPHCFLPFALLKKAKYMPVIWSTYGLVYVFFGTWPLWKPLAKMVLRPQHEQRAEKKDN